jgi:hypothetical protein
MNSERIQAVVSRLADYVRSPSLRHLRDHNNLKLAREIVEAIDRTDPVWTKWTPAREEVVKAAANCWIPADELRDFLNGLPGPPLTATDLSQRLRAVWEEPWSPYPNDDIQAGCLALYAAEKALGTEMRAIIGTLQEFVEGEEERLRRERDERWKQIREQDRLRLQEHFRSGADCGWTSLGETKDLFCRRNGKAFRVSQDTDKRWKLYQLGESNEAGELLGTYSGRREASAAVQQIAYRSSRPR